MKINIYKTEISTVSNTLKSKLVGWLCLTFHRQRGQLETAPPFTVPCEGS